MYVVIQEDTFILVPMDAMELKSHDLNVMVTLALVAMETNVKAVKPIISMNL